MYFCVSVTVELCDHETTEPDYRLSPLNLFYHAVSVISFN